MITEYFKREDYWCGDLSAWPKVNEDEYHMFVDPTEDETRLYNCGGLPVELTLPEGEHQYLKFSVDWMWGYGNT